jgi:hypothetical protein
LTRPALLILLLSLLSCSLSTQATAASPPASVWAAAASSPAGELLERVRQARPPLRDLVELHRRIVWADQEAASAALDADALWVLNLDRRAYEAVPVDLRLSSPHADWYVEQGRAAADLTQAAEFFETRLLPLTAELFGSAWQPGQQGANRIAIYTGRIRGVAGYMSASDGYPRSVYPYSNERPLLYLNLDAVRPGSSAYRSVLAHEFEHLLQAQFNETQEGWLDEGLAELFATLATASDPPRADAFRANPDVQLTAWGPTPGESGLHYQASTLWARYLMERAGGPSALAALVQGGGQGLESIDRLAASSGAGPNAEALFRDWLVANLLDDPSGDGRYGYQSIDQRSVSRQDLTLDGPPIVEQVHQYGADYYRLAAAGPAELQVAVEPTVPLVETGSDQAVFWSLRGDNLDTRLSRQFDLSNLAAVELRFRLWYDLEPDYDVCFVSASSDGQRWLPLAGRWTSTANPTAAAPGPHYSGSSDGAWREEQVDLTAFAGRPVEVRFECLTDQSTALGGLLLDDLEIPQLGFLDDGEQDRGWLAEGFVRGPNIMAQPSALLLVERAGGQVTVRDLALDEAGNGVQQLAPAGPETERYLVVSGLAPRTLEPMRYQLRLVSTGS